MSFSGLIDTSRNKPYKSHVHFSAKYMIWPQIRRTKGLLVLCVVFN